MQPKNMKQLFIISRTFLWRLNFFEILIVLTGIFLAAFLYQKAVNLSDLLDNARSFDRNTRQMLFSTSLAYINFNRLIDGDSSLSLQKDVSQNLDTAQDLCTTIFSDDQGKRFIPPQLSSGEIGQNSLPICDQLQKWRELTKVRWQAHMNGDSVSNQAEYELAFTNFIKQSQPFESVAAPQLQKLETQMRQANILPSIIMGCVFFVIAFIVRRNRLNSEKQMKQLFVEIEQHNLLNEALAVKQNLLSTLINIIPDPIYAKDKQNQFMIANIAAAKKMGVSKPENLLGRDENDFQPEEIAIRILEEDRITLNTGMPVIDRQETLLDRASGKLQHLLTTKIPLRDNRDQIYGFVGITKDITIQKQGEEALRLANQKLTEGIAELERRKREADLLAELVDLLQACPNIDEACLVIAKQMKQFFPDDSGILYLFKSSRNVLEQMAFWGASLADLPVFKPDDCWGLRLGRMHIFENRAAPLQNSDIGNVLVCQHIISSGPADYLCIPLVAQGEALGILHLRHFQCEAAGSSNHELAWYHALKMQHIHMIVDSLSLALANLKLRSTLRQQSIRDPLTTMFNRRYLEETLERELLRSSRTSKMVGIMMVDIDHFKRFNDTFGHQAGDTLLSTLGHLLQTSIRDEDIACRYGGEEFILMLPESTLEVTARRAQEICDKVRGLNVQFQGQSLGTITLSIGVAIFPQHGQNMVEVIQAADQALYRAKADGRDRVVIVNDLPAI